jgi:hypothetical protein
MALQLPVEVWLMVFDALKWKDDIDSDETYRYDTDYDSATYEADADESIRRDDIDDVTVGTECTECYITRDDPRDDHKFLWEIVRNTSRHLRNCVDIYIRHDLLRGWLFDLHYSEFCTIEGPSFRDIHIPMVFDRFSDDGTRAIFQQRAYKNINYWNPGYLKVCMNNRGVSLRQWVPFIQRYCVETQKSGPKVVDSSKPSAGPPLWNNLHAHWRNPIPKEKQEKKKYLATRRHATTIGRGDYAPYSFKIDTQWSGHFQEGELVELEVDCERGEISFDWRRTYAAAYWGQRAPTRLCKRHNNTSRVWDPELIEFDSRVRYGRLFWSAPRWFYEPRRKRLEPWVTRNKHRVSSEDRWIAENDAYARSEFLSFLLQRNNMCELGHADIEEPEYDESDFIHEGVDDILVWKWIVEDKLVSKWEKRLHDCWSQPHPCKCIYAKYLFRRRRWRFSLKLCL